jgi:2-oxoglutarate dehydrogenase E2 component (dihydrolipoamide succinyltransferase)
MEIDVRVPEVGEAVQEALVAEWYKKDGDRVRKDEVLLLIETDKVTLEVVAPADGVMKRLVPEGETVAIGTVVAKIELEAARVESEETKAPSAADEPRRVERPEAVPARAEIEAEAPEGRVERQTPRLEEERAPEAASLLTPSVEDLLSQRGLDASVITGTGPGGRITRGDVLLYEEELPEDVRKKTGKPGKPSEPGESRVPPTSRATAPPIEPPQRREAAPEDLVERKPMSRIRQRIAERLLEARQSTAMLTTFNEIDMSRVQSIRKLLKESFQKKHGVSLGFMSFFVKACTIALKEIPQVNAFIENQDIVYHQKCHIGIAIGAERGLVVPVIRNADELSFAKIEQAIAAFVEKIRSNRLELSDLEGGTFTITNGGVYGSLLSTPILNPPQSGILGMHRVQDRPVAVDGRVEIRPMMYVALSYDHRLIDGREAVTFLKRVKECVENPERMMVEI